MILELASELIERRSITPEDAGCINLLAARLERAGFSTTRLKHGDVDNAWLTHGSGDPVLCLLGHTDVVPPGPAAAWHGDPFVPEVRDGCLYGRGAADMKGSLAAMTVALERYVTACPGHGGTVALLLTSDEEGRAVDGTARVVEHLLGQGVRIKWCIVGEPSSEKTAGDTVKNGRRGSVTGHLEVRGIQGHVAYPDRADNPVHRLLPALARLSDIEWDRGDAHYSPTRLQISNIHAGTGADNVIPGSVNVQFNLRHSTAVTEAQIKDRIEGLLREHDLDYRLDWLPSSRPFLTASGELLDAARAAIREASGVEPAISTAGGTSDGRFVAPTGAEVIELGPVNRTIHQVNECVSLKDLELLGEMYGKIVEKLLGK